MPSRSPASGGWPAASATEVVGTPVAHGALEMTLETDDPAGVRRGGRAALRHRHDARNSPPARRGAGSATSAPMAGASPIQIGSHGSSGLAIPPAWTDVWISPVKRGHIQAVGRDARGRKQYRYHPRWREVRDEAKYGRMIEFARALPRIRRRTDRDLRRRGLPREKVLALVVRLLEATLIRVGNEEYARENRTFGLSTLRDRHVKGRGRQRAVQLHGKGGQGARGSDHGPAARAAREAVPGDARPGAVPVRRRRRDGASRSTPEEVNEYLREITGEEFTAKEFRTWAGTVAASMALQDFLEIDDDAGRKKAIVGAIEEVASQLGNTPAVCRACYVHPDILDSLPRRHPGRRPRRARSRGGTRRPRAAPRGGRRARTAPVAAGARAAQAAARRLSTPYAASPSRPSARW